MYIPLFLLPQFGVWALSCTARKNVVYYINYKTDRAAL